MNPVVAEIMAYNQSRYELMHYGILRRSGRYPWGSGENPYQHSGDFLSRVSELRSQGFTYTDENGKTWTGDTAIAKSMGLSTTEFRAQMSLANYERRSVQVATAKDLREKGYSLSEIAEQMGFDNDSSVRSLLNADSEVRMNQAMATAEVLKTLVNEKGYIDVGKGTNLLLGDISEEKLNEALYILELEGYPVYNRRVPQVTNEGQFTTLKILCPQGTEYKDLYSDDFDFSDVKSVDDYISYDGGDTYVKSFVYPASMDSSRLMIRYAEDGGVDKDGLIEIRRGVDDLSLGESHYAQVRILVDDNLYIKGMAVYSDDLPDGVDVIFNTNKTSDKTLSEVLKTISDDPDNPFGSLIKEVGGQSYYTDEDGNVKLSLINKRADEGDWGQWSNELPSQFLSKQNYKLIETQLSLALSEKQSEYEEICALTNPVLKKQLLQTFADECESASITLKAAALPGQQYQVILPLTTIGDTEIYAPNYENGTTVALVRYPHGGTFEIPILTVNNKNAEGDSIITKTADDAVGISAAVAARLSGADFDGDTVMVIPCNSSNSKVTITSTAALKDLEGFDPKMSYGTVQKSDGYYNQYGQKVSLITTSHQSNNEMGKISNLITDMTIKGATESELARAVKHSMVVIDAKKHKLDYKQSEIDNDIDTLKRRYQAHEDDDGYGGVSTLISRAKSTVNVLKRVGSPRIAEDGSLYYKEVEETYTTKSGKTKTRTIQVPAMSVTSDAYTLSSGTQVESYYAAYANSLKDLANSARKTMVSTENTKKSASAAKTYASEVSSLLSKLNTALSNAPKERQAQLLANSVVKAKKESNASLTNEQLKKIKQQALTSARAKVGAKRSTITITDSEWTAIQSGAVSSSKLSQIFKYCDSTELKKRATPKSSSNALSATQINRIKAYAAAGYTNAEIAAKLGVSTSTVSKYS